MDITKIIGIFAYVIGTIGLLAYALRWMHQDNSFTSKIFNKLPYYEQSYGKMGIAIHFIKYVVLPLAIGTLLLGFGFQFKI